MGFWKRHYDFHRVRLLAFRAASWPVALTGRYWRLGRYHELKRLSVQGKGYGLHRLSWFEVEFYKRFEPGYPRRTDNWSSSFGIV